jgi:hypothetical protein
VIGGDRRDGIQHIPQAVHTLERGGNQYDIGHRGIDIDLRLVECSLQNVVVIQRDLQMTRYLVPVSGIVIGHRCDVNAARTTCNA